MKHVLHHIIAVLTAVLLPAIATGCIMDDVPDGQDPVSAGDRLPQFSVTMDNGKTVSPQSLFGSWAVIVFFNTGCPDCRRELPEIESLYRMRPDVEVLCVAREEGAEEIAAYWAENDLTLPWSAQPDRKVFNLFAMSGIPRVFVVSAEGVITAAFSDTDAPDAVQLSSLIPYPEM